LLGRRQSPGPSQDSTDTGAKGAWQRHIPIACLCAATAVGLLGYWRTKPPPLVADEWDVVLPALKYIAGHITTDVKYPSFSYYVYGFFIALAGALGDENTALLVARGVSAALFVGNLLLHYACARRYLSPPWATAATAGLVGMPWVLFTGIVVKTEGLQLTAVLLSLLAHQRLDGLVRQRRWFVVAALAAAAGLAIKLNALPLSMMVCHAAFRAWRKDAPFTGAELLIFLAAFTVSLPVFWTNLWVFREIMANTWQADVYFQSGPVVFSSLDSPYAIPHGRFPSFLLVTLPLSLGYFSLFWIGAATLRSGGVTLHAVFGGATTAVLVAGLLATCMRMPHPFSPYTLYFHLAGWVFVGENIARFSIGRPWLPRVMGPVLAGLLSAQLVESLKVIDFVQAMAATEAQNAKSQIAAVAFLPRSKEHLPELVAMHKPDVIYTTTMLFEQLAKYPRSAGYEVDRAFYADLASGKLPYRLRRRVPFPFPFAFLSLDSQYRNASFVSFERTRDAP
jgi:hypothetical protein